MDTKLYNVKEVAQVLKVNVHYVYALIQQGLLPALKLGSWKVRTEALDEFLKKYECYDLSDLSNICKVDYYNNVEE